MKFLDNLIIFSNSLIKKITKKNETLKEISPVLDSSSKGEGKERNFEKSIDEITKEEKDYIAHHIVIGQFVFVKELTKALNGRKESDKTEILIIKETIEELEFLLNRKKNVM